MDPFVFSLREIDKTKLEVAGGKGANLGEVARIDGITVPDGFCISTEAFKRVISETSSINPLLDQLALVTADNRHKAKELSIHIRNVIEAVNIPSELNGNIARQLSILGENNAYAVRSSATAEDLPDASFAGQQDTYLNIIGRDAIITHICKCWASLFTERAIIYRIQNGFDHRKVRLAVLVQKMVFPQVAGILFTADPVTSNRKVVSIDASFGLGEAMVSGLVNADVYKVCDGKIIDKKISAKKLAIYALKEGGTREQQVEPGSQNEQALTDEQILKLEHLGRKIEHHFGYPQDIEWCIENDRIYVVQSRPITTLYPIPVPPGRGQLKEMDQEEHRVYVSVGHQQMMTDALKPLGLSVWQLTAVRPMYEAGGRLFVDISSELASLGGRNVILNVLGKSDPLIKDAITTIVDRDFIKLLPENNADPAPANNESLPGKFQKQTEYDSGIVADLISTGETSIAELRETIQSNP